MVGEGWRKYLNGSLRLKVEEGRPSGDVSVGAETPHEARLRIALHAACIDAVVIACGAITVKAKMNGMLSKRGVAADERCCCS
jgi:hypothetical protein